MPAYTSGKFVYFKNNEERPQSHHKSFILNQVSRFYITSPLKNMAETLVSLPKLLVFLIFLLWIKVHIQKKSLL